MATTLRYGSRHWEEVLSRKERIHTNSTSISPSQPDISFFSPLRSKTVLDIITSPVVANHHCSMVDLSPTNTQNSTLVALPKSSINCNSYWSLLKSIPESIASWCIVSLNGVLESPLLILFALSLLSSVGVVSFGSHSSITDIFECIWQVSSITSFVF